MSTQWQVRTRMRSFADDTFQPYAKNFETFVEAHLWMLQTSTMSRLTDGGFSLVNEDGVELASLTRNTLYNHAVETNIPQASVKKHLKREHPNYHREIGRNMGIHDIKEWSAEALDELLTFDHILSLTPVKSHIWHVLEMSFPGHLTTVEEAIKAGYKPSDADYTALLTAAAPLTDRPAV